MASLDDLKIVLQSIDNTMTEQKSSMLNLVGLQQETVNQISSQTNIFSSLIAELETKNRLASVDTTATPPAEVQQNKSMGAAVGAAAAPGIGEGIGAAGGLIGLGAGIAGFMAALSIGSIGLDWLGSDYSGLGDAFASFSDAMENLSPAAITALAGASAIAAGTASFKNLYGLGTASGMVGLGAGISGFLVGLSLGEIGLGWVGNDYSNVGEALASFSAAIGNLSVEAVGLLGGLAAVAIANTAFKGDAKSLAMSMAGISAGIGGFLGGLVLADVGLGWITSITGADGSALVSAFQMFNDSMAVLSPTSVLALAAIITAAGGLPKMSPTSLAKNMTGIGAGIAGFMAGLAAGEVGIEWINSVPAGSGEGLVSSFKIFNEAIMALSPTAMTALGVLMAAAGPLGGSVAVGLPLIGVGLAGFMAALAGADAAITTLSSMTGGEPGEGLKSLFTNIFEGIGAAKALNGVDLLMLGPGLISFAAGLAAFGVGNLIGTIANLGPALLGLFGVDNPFDQIMDIAKNSSELIKGGEALNTIADALSKFSGIKISGIDIDFKQLATDLGQAIPFLDALANGGPVEGSGGWLGLGKDINFPKGLLDPSLKLSEMAEAISKVNVILGQSTAQVSQPDVNQPPAESNLQNATNVTQNDKVESADVYQSITSATNETLLSSEIITKHSERMIELSQNIIKSLEIIEKSVAPKETAPTNVSYSPVTNAPSNTYVGGTTNTTVITPRSSNDLDYGLPRAGF